MSEEITPATDEQIAEWAAETKQRLDSIWRIVSNPDEDPKRCCERAYDLMRGWGYGPPVNDGPGRVEGADDAAEPTATEGGA